MSEDKTLEEKLKDWEERMDKKRREEPEVNCATCKMQAIGIPTPGYPHAVGCPKRQP